MFIIFRGIRIKKPKWSEHMHALKLMDAVSIKINNNNYNYIYTSIVLVRRVDKKILNYICGHGIWTECKVCTPWLTAKYM